MRPANDAICINMAASNRALRGTAADRKQYEAVDSGNHNSAVEFCVKATLYSYRANFQ